MTATPPELRQCIDILVSWRGGPGIDVVSIVHNGARVPQGLRRTFVEQFCARIEYQVPRAPRHQVHGVFSFIGDVRSNLRLHCMIDGVDAGNPIHAGLAEHRWEVRAAWTPPSPRR